VVLIDHFLIQCSKPMIDSTSSCPLSVSRYSTRGGISLNACLSSMPAFCSSFSLMASVLLLKPFNVCLNFKYLTGFVVQQSGIRSQGVAIEWGVTLTAFAQADRDRSLTATLRHSEGRLEELEPSYLIDAEGAHSIIRPALRIEFKGKTREEHYALGDLFIDACRKPIYTSSPPNMVFWVSSRWGTAVSAWLPVIL
jgi:hypothetical protein